MIKEGRKEEGNLVGLMDHQRIRGWDGRFDKLI